MAEARDEGDAAAAWEFSPERLSATVSVGVAGDISLLGSAVPSGGMEVRR
ncbi:MAG: hypothetical protein HC881_03275 [Leptolyngbyaceae cyanobacterium SL_7_1]|nr:hypothetical protein [Leptolyngbyaceae cyanobacterium SL_7_1]